MSGGIALIISVLMILGLHYLVHDAFLNLDEKVESRHRELLSRLDALERDR